MRRNWEKEDLAVVQNVISDPNLGDTLDGAKLLMAALPHKQPQTILNVAMDLRPNCRAEFVEALSKANAKYIHRVYDLRQLIDGELWYGVSAIREHLKRTCKVTHLAQKSMWPLPYASTFRKWLEDGKVRQRVINGGIVYSLNDACAFLGVPSREVPLALRARDPRKAAVVATGPVAPVAAPVTPEATATKPADELFDYGKLKQVRAALVATHDAAAAKLAALRAQVSAAEAEETEALGQLVSFDERISTLMNALLGNT